MNEYMKEAKRNAEDGIDRNDGGPFGAVVVDNNGDIVGSGNNRVIVDKDPTAHAEMVAIREACKNLNTYDLSNCTLYTTCEPCPMCLSATIWSNIKKVYYGATRNDAALLGFRDQKIYDFIRGAEFKTLQLNQLSREECLKIFRKYREYKGIIY